MRQQPGVSKRRHSRVSFLLLDPGVPNRWARPYDLAHTQSPGRLLLNRELARTVIPVNERDLPVWLARDANLNVHPHEFVVERWFLDLVDFIVERSGAKSTVEGIRAATRATSRLDPHAMREVFLLEGTPGVMRVLEVAIPRHGGVCRGGV